ncbi:MAG: hypothetical protein M3016_10150 [Actinomycetota bacterium]|nr:hypothetical protein [Actinomycetota bacterium]
MPSFCRHNRLIHNCPVCAREQNLELRPVVSGGDQTGRTAVSASRPSPRTAKPPRTRTATARAASGLRVHRLVRDADDGYRSDLVPGLKSSADAGRLAGGLAWAQARLASLATDPPGLFVVVADPALDIEERSWLALLISYLGPLNGAAPFAEIERVRTTWASGELPSLEGVQVGPRGAHAPQPGLRTLVAYRAWAARSGSQAAAFTGDPLWTAQRRFSRAFERLALPGLTRGARFELLVALGQTATFDLRAATLGLGGSDQVTLAAKRVFGIGDPMLLERRAGALATACGIDLAALDAGLDNWERETPAQLGVEPDVEPDPSVLAGVHAALGL